MSRPNTKTLNASQAKRMRVFFSERLKKSQGAGGRTLPAKKNPNGKPLGGRIRDVLLTGKIRARKYGFTLDYSRKVPVTGFHFGFDPNQVPRPIVDYPDELLKENAQEFLDILTNYGKRLGAFSGRPIRVSTR